MVKATIKKGSTSKKGHIKCPRCGSRDVQVEKKGFDYGNACGGAICFGPLGLLCGGLDSKTLMATCLKCGKHFNAQKQLEKNWHNKN